MTSWSSHLRSGYCTKWRTQGGFHGVFALIQYAPPVLTDKLLQCIGRNVEKRNLHLKWISSGLQTAMVKNADQRKWRQIFPSFKLSAFPSALISSHKGISHYIPEITAKSYCMHNVLCRRADSRGIRSTQRHYWWSRILRPLASGSHWLAWWMLPAGGRPWRRSTGSPTETTTKLRFTVLSTSQGINHSALRACGGNPKLGAEMYVESTWIFSNLSDLVTCW